jgi:hypothetical protein
MPNESEQTPAGIPIFGIFCAVLVVILLILTAERSGLPQVTAEWFVRISILFALLSSLWFGRSAAERLFFGRESTSPWRGGGLILGVIILVATQTSFWFAGLIGAVFGVITAHIFLHFKYKRDNRSLIELATTPHSLQQKFILGIALCCLGAMIALPSLIQAISYVGPKVSGHSQVALTFILFLAIMAVALGGAKGTIAMIAMLTLIAVGGIFACIGIGLLTFGTLPLPGFEEPTTLKAMAEVKNSLGLSKALVLQHWPGLSMIFNLDEFTAFTIAALTSCAVALILSPAIEIRQRSVLATTSLTLILLPILLIAIGGYSIEAITEYLIGSPINNPPIALLDAARLGLLQICGGFPETIDALRSQCSVSPREATTLDLEKLKVQDSFVQTGLSVSLGYTATINQAILLFPLALSLVGVVTGIWLMALGITRYVLMQRHDAPGLASHRIASTRMAAILSAALLLAFSQFGLVPSAKLTAILGGAASAIILLIHLMAYVVSIRAPRQNPQAA